MSGNSIGQNLILTTYGESHGAAIGGVLDGAPAGIPLDEAAIQAELDRRKPGTSRHVTPRQEDDRLHLLSGIFAGKTTGTPIGLLIHNEDQRSRDYGAIKDQYRPGHADYTYHAKYGIRDYRGGGRASARETAIRVAGGAIAKQILPFNCPNDHHTALLDRYLADIRRDGDSIGAEITVIAENVPAGLGEPVFDRLDADIAKALMSINAVKGVAIGDGFAVIQKRGSENRDERSTASGFHSNHAGGILGGISSGQTILARAAFKPTSSILIPGHSTDVHGVDVEVVTKGRHDPCVALRACPIVEAMLALTLADHYLRQRGQHGR